MQGCGGPRTAGVGRSGAVLTSGLNITERSQQHLDYSFGRAGCFSSSSPSLHLPLHTVAGQSTVRNIPQHTHAAASSPPIRRSPQPRTGGVWGLAACQPGQNYQATKVKIARWAASRSSEHRHTPAACRRWRQRTHPTPCTALDTLKRDCPLTPHDTDNLPLHPHSPTHYRPPVAFLRDSATLFPSYYYLSRTRGVSLRKN